MNLQYPIGKFLTPKNISAEQLADWINQIQTLPQKLRLEVQDLMEMQLDTPYRPEGWTVRQVVHHLPDSHLNSYIRFKLTLTEDKPTIRPYFEDRWAELPDSKASIEISIRLLEALHERWVVLLKSMTTGDFEKMFVHPEYGKEYPLKEVVALYAWHGNHHLAHITGLKERMGW